MVALAVLLIISGQYLSDNSVGSEIRIDDDMSVGSCKMIERGDGRGGQRMTMGNRKGNDNYSSLRCQNHPTMLI